MRFHPDSPITKTGEDALGRDEYAQSIAEAVRSYGPADSVTIGVVGPWGSGKTSLINLIVDYLEPDNKSGELVVYRFNPWRYAGTDYLFASFFAGLSRKLELFDSVETLKKAASNLKAVSKITGLFKIVPHVGGALGAISGLFQSASGNVEGLVAEVQTIDAIHASLQDELGKAKKRVLVVIDDIDRLDASDIKDVFRLVKSLANFPYVMYMLAYDEDVILKAIDPDVHVARRYLEKIVTLPIPVPAPHQGALDDMVLRGIYALMEPDVPPFLNERRLFEAFEAFKLYFNTVREVTRFSNVFAFNFARLRKIVDIGDLAAISALEVFEPELHRAIPKQPDAFIDDTKAAWRQDRTKPAENKARLEAIMSSVTLSNPETALECLREIFHKVDLAWKGHQYQFSGEAERSEHRISSPEFFFKAFNMGTSPDKVSDQEYEEALSFCYVYDSKAIGFLDGLGLARTQDFISRLESDKGILTRSRDERVNLLASLLDIIERHQFGDASDGVPFDWKIGFSIDHILEGLGPAEWLDALRAALQKSNAASSVLNYASSTLAILAEGHNRHRIPDLAEPQQEELRALVVAQVERALSDLSLKANLRLARIIYVLEEWGQDDLVARILSAIRDDPSAFLKLLVSYRQRGGFEGLLKPTAMRFSIDGLTRHFSIMEANDILGRLDEETLSEDERRAINSFRQHGNTSENDE